jgi:Protein of unknown function with HXXEE motif
MAQQSPGRLSQGLLFAPLVFVAHFLEESPGLTLTNAIFHITGAIVDRGYVPGLATAVLLYLPYCGWVAGQVVRSRLVAPGLLAAAAVLGAIPMAVHGYRILFLGTRLF